MDNIDKTSIVHLVDDDDAVRNSIHMSLSVEGLIVKEYSSAIEFLEKYNNQPGCLVADIQMPKMSGLELQKDLNQKNINIPIIFISGHGNIPTSVKAMKSGAIDFIEKPFAKKELLSSICSALQIDFDNRKAEKSILEIQNRFDLLTSREREVIDMLAKDNAKLTNKEIAELLGISKRTIEVHRSNIMAKMLAKTRAELVELYKSCTSSLV
jgi:two-component system response regulator FixJ